MCGCLKPTTNSQEQILDEVLLNTQNNVAPINPEVAEQAVDVEEVASPILADSSLIAKRLAIAGVGLGLLAAAGITAWFQGNEATVNSIALEVIFGGIGLGFACSAGCYKA